MKQNGLGTKAALDEASACLGSILVWLSFFAVGGPEHSRIDFLEPVWPAWLQQVELLGVFQKQNEFSSL